MQEQTSSNSQEANVPKLRFPGFEGEYRITTLAEIADKIVRTDPNSDAPIMMISAASGFINQSEKYSRENAGQSLKKYTLLKKGELAYNHGASKLRQFGCCFELKEKAARIPYVYHTFSINEKEYAPYIALLLNNPIMDRQLKRLVSSSVRMDGLLNISYDEYISIKLRIPMLKAEQEKLYAFIEKLDQRIERQRQLVDALKSYKRGALLRLFPKNGESVPEYRFSEFTGDWKQRKLGEVLLGLQNNTLSRAELSYDEGTVKNVHYGDILVKYGEVIDVKNEQLPNIIDEKIAEKYKASFLQNGDIVFADTAEDETVGKCSEIAGLTDEMIISGLHTIPYRSQIKFATGYLGYYFNSSEYHQQLVPLMQGIKVTSISKSAMQGTDVKFPKTIEEQAKIVCYFRNLDTLITLHQRKLDEYKSIKQGLLEKLFI